MKKLLFLFTAALVIMLGTGVDASNDSHLTMSFSYENLEIYAIKQDGSLWACSVDEYTGERGEFKKIMDDAVSVSGNYAIKEDGSLWTWGYNLFTDEYEEEPIQVMEDVKEVSEKTSNSWHLLITKNDNSLWGIGSNYCGQLAQGEINEEVQLPWGPFYVPDNISEPVKIMDDVKKAEAGTSHSLILKTDGSIWTIGFGLVRGTGNIESSNIPAKVMDNANNIFAGGLSSYVVADDGKDTVWRWGTFIPETSSTTDEESQMTPIKYISDVKKLTNLFGYVLAVKNDGSLWAYGKTEDVAKTPYDTEIYINETMKIIDDVDNVTGFAGPINIALVLKNNGELYLFELTGEEEQQYTLTKILDGVRLSEENDSEEETVSNNVSDINNSGCIVKYNDKIYYYYISSDKDIWGLYEYDTASGESTKLDDVDFCFSPLYIINEKLYYAFTDNPYTFTLYSIDLNNTASGAKEEAVIEEDMTTVTAGDMGEEFSIFKNGDIYFLANSNLYKIENGAYELTASDIASVYQDENRLYYSKTDGSGTIYSYNGVSSSVLLDGEILRTKDDYIRVILGGNPNPLYIRCVGERVYFIASTIPGSRGRVYSFDVNDPEGTLTQMTKDSATNSYKVYNKIPYFIFDGKLCFFADGQQEETGLKNVIFFNIIDDSVYLVQYLSEDDIGFCRIPYSGGRKEILNLYGYNKLNVYIVENEISVALNGVRTQFPDAQPFVDENDRTQIPIRALAELLDFDVSWNGDTLTAELIKDDTIITIKIGENHITKNGETIAIDTAARVINDRTYIPLRAVGEALGCEVEWNQN